jgi:SAM-dependent methyltransferase
MSDERNPTGETNGVLWGARAADWAALQEIQCRPVYEAVMEKVQLGRKTQYLDAGCGTGLAAQLAEEQGAHVSAFDASGSLLEIARTRLKSAVIKQGDLETLPFEDGSFDVVTGFNSFQYAANPGKALAEGRRVSKRGGIVAIVTWGPPEGMAAAKLVAALRPLMPPPRAGAPGPFALSNGGALRDFASGAGLEPQDVFDVESPFYYASLEDGVRGLGSSGVAAKARQNAGDEAVDRAHTEALAEFRQTDGSYRISATFRCLIARA